MRVLLDASADVETLLQVHQLIEQQPAVVEVKSVLGRNAGRYRCIEAEVGLRVQVLDKAHQISHAIAAAIRNQIPHVERLLVHVEPTQRPVRRVAVPLANRAGTVSVHFGTAPYFALTEIYITTGEIVKQTIVVNPYAADPRGRGLKVAHWLLDQRVDVLITADDVRGKGPGYALGDAGVMITVTDAIALDAALAANLDQHALG
jgi:predicted Fe-Mo cluster-binding NifX family protein